jgi:hypothetical protein
MGRSQGYTTIMADFVVQSIHRSWSTGIVLGAVMSLCACTGSNAAGVDASQLTYSGPNSSTTGTTKSPSTSVDPNPSLTNSDPNSTKSPPSINPNLMLSVVHPNPAPTAVAGINISPRIALGECLDLSYGTPVNASPLALYWCNGFAAAQSWQYAAGQLRLDTSWCLDVSSSDPSRATNAILNQCDTEGTRAGQYWNFVDGMLQIAGSNICLTVPDANATIQKNMLVGGCDPSNPLQQWAVDNNSTVGTIGVTISNQANLKVCLDIYGSRTTVGAAVDVWTCNYSPSQQWIWQSMELQALGQCLQASTSTAAMQPCDPSNPQQQWVTDRGRLKLYNSERCLDLVNGQSDHGSPLLMTTCSMAPSQQWVWGAP